MGWGRSDLETQDFHPHAVFDGTEAAEDEGQGRCPREDAEQPGTKAGMRGSRTLTHTHSLLTCDAPCTQHCPVLSHTVRSSREPNKNTHLTPPSLQAGASRLRTVP